MAAADDSTWDWEKLLAPLEGASAAGNDLRTSPEGSSLFFQLKDAREAARVAERELQRNTGGNDHDLAEHDRAELRDRREQAQRTIQQNWPIVGNLALRVLSEKSKDLWVVAWLIESQVRARGFAGLRDGIRLMRELVERYWDDIYPRPDEDGFATPLAQWNGLNGEESDGALMGPMEAIALTPKTGSFPAFSFADYRAAGDLESAKPEVRAKRIEGGAPTIEMISRAAREAPAGYFAGLQRDIQDAIDEFRQLTEQLDPRCSDNTHGYAAPFHSSRVQQRLFDALDRVRVVARDQLPTEASADTGAVSGELTVTAAEPTNLATARVYDRDEAFRALLRVADFFRRTEPHSPVSYALEQAVRWGRMPLPELMRELVGDESVLRDVFRRTGIPDTQENRD